MKRLVALALALCLLAAGALADNTITNTSESKQASTTVTYTIAETYTVTIPSSVSLSSSGVTSAMITASNVRLSANNELVVYISAIKSAGDGDGDPQVMCNGEGIPYGIYLEPECKEAQGSGTWVFNGKGAGTASIYFKLLGTPTYSGVYTDQITFAVMVNGGSLDDGSSVIVK